MPVDNKANTNKVHMEVAPTTTTARTGYPGQESSGDGSTTTTISDHTLSISDPDLAPSGTTGDTGGINTGTYSYYEPDNSQTVPAGIKILRTDGEKHHHGKHRSGGGGHSISFQDTTDDHHHHHNQQQQQQKQQPQQKHGHRSSNLKSKSMRVLPSTPVSPTRRTTPVTASGQTPTTAPSVANFYQSNLKLQAHHISSKKLAIPAPELHRLRMSKSTNLSHIRLPPETDINANLSDFSDDGMDATGNRAAPPVMVEIPNIYLDNNNASDDNEAVAILPVEARELLLQEEEERKSRLAKESTSLLKIPGSGGLGGLGGRRESKYFPGRIRKRVILKNGNINLSPEHVDKRSRRYLQDTFTTMVDIRWRWNLLVFAMGFFLSWFAFAIIWWLIAFSHADFEHLGDDDWTPCIYNLNGFSAAYLFSIETQHTIGYGSRYTTEECPEAILLQCLQSITGVILQCFMVGFVFAKLSRPQKRSQTLMFSRYAVINQRDRRLCLMFRVGDLRDRSHIIGARITAQVIRKKMTAEGELIPYFHYKLPVKFDELEDEVFLIWPATIVHVIDRHSPFYTMNVDDMAREKFEIVAILEGTVESTGQTVQARSSYLPSEILWGHRFEQLVRYRHDTGEYLVDYSKFNNTFDVDMPFCSAKELEEEYKMMNDNDDDDGNESL